MDPVVLPCLASTLKLAFLSSADLAFPARLEQVWDGQGLGWGRAAYRLGVEGLRLKKAG